MKNILQLDAIEREQKTDSIVLSGVNKNDDEELLK